MHKTIKKAAAAALLAALFALPQAAFAAVQAPVVASRNVTGEEYTGQKATVYFTRHIDGKHLKKIFDLVGKYIDGKVAIKLHTGEKGGRYFLPPSLVKKLQRHIPGSVIADTNTMFKRSRGTTEDHRQLLKDHHWTFCPVDILDEEGARPMPASKWHHLKEVSMGSHLWDYDSLVVLTHFKGHEDGGFGGSLKNIAIGCADGKVGKRQVHGFNETRDPERNDWTDNMATKDTFMENMADSGRAVLDHFGDKIVFINILRKLSVDCDCAGARAAAPSMPDIGIIASTDLLAADQAACDLIYGSSHAGRKDLAERIESRHGLRQLTAMKELDMGEDAYELIDIDETKD